MSMRAVRKLQELKRLEKDENKEESKPIEEEGNSTESGDTNETFRVCNRFDLLNEATHSETETKGCDESSEVLSDSTVCKSSFCLASESGNIFPSAKTGAKKKKRKKKKKSVDYRYSSIWSEDKSDADEIEKCVREVNAILGEVDNEAVLKESEDGAKPIRSPLRVDYKHLNPQNELKRIFGARVVQANDNSNKRRNSRQGQGNTRPSRVSRIIVPQPHWKDRAKSGLSMSLERSSGPLNYFRFHHNASYQQAQFRFLRASGSLDTDNVLRLLHLEPFHVDTLLQVSEIFRLADDSAMAAQLIERAIFIMECASHPLFNVSSGNVRMNYRQQENRGFFIALFRHILVVGNKGCYRTALELCKLLLSLSPDDDPLAVSLMIDFYAVRAQEYGWLVSLYDLYEPTKHLSMLPNFAFSVSLALFHLSEPEDGQSENLKGKMNSSYTAMRSSKDLRRRADDMLQKAIFMFPAVVSLLMDKCNVQTDNRAESHPYFGLAAQTKMSKGLSQLVKLYVERSYHLWKEQSIILWLEANFSICLEKAKEDVTLAESCEEKRSRRYQSPPTAINRHIILSEIKEVTPSLPPSSVDNPVMNFDPLPPPDSVCDYRPPSPSIEDPSASNILLSFLRGILPEYDHRTMPFEEGFDGAVEGAVGNDNVDGNADEGNSVGSNLQTSVSVLLQAMRDLFANMNSANAEAAADASADTDHNDSPDADNADNWE